MIGCLSSTRKGLSSMQRRRQQTSKPRMAERLADSITTLAHWLRQVGMDTSEGKLSWARLTMTHEFSQLFWYMRQEGWQWRGLLAHQLYEGDDYLNAWPDPCEHIPYSPRRFVLQGAKEQHIDLVHLSENIHQYAEELDGGRRRIYAFLQTWPDNQRPLLFIDETPPAGWNQEEHEANWTFQAGQVLGQYYTNTGMYHGDLAPAGTILPPDPHRESHMTPLLHQFAKALLGLPKDCPVGAPCGCRSIMYRASMVPPRHPEMTGELHLGERAPAAPTHLPP